ncbi:MAG: rhomboid family intramembrane serine protease [Anaerolineae bacterium]
MLPIGDVNRSRRAPVATILIILLNLAVWVYQLTLSPSETIQFYQMAGVVPVDVTTHFTPAEAFTFLSAMFIHGGWAHILGNMLYLWIFGDNIEDRLGFFPYIAFYLAAGVLASLAQVLASPGSDIPTVGASGAIAGVLGAYLVLYPHARVRTLVFLFVFIRFVQLPALLVLGLWFVLQLFNGLTQLGGGDAGGVAYLAHVGGFTFGVLVGFVLKAATPRRWDQPY